MTGALAAGAAAVVVLALARRLRWLTAGGAAAAVGVGAAVLAGAGAAGLALLLAFFVSASLLTRLGGPEKPAAGPEHGPSAGVEPGPGADRAGGAAAGRGRGPAAGSGRTAAQVLANGGPAAAAALIGLAGRPGAGQVALLGALAAATADTWATEIGTFVRGETRRITTWAPVPPGSSGGVSRAGTLGGLAGAALLGLAAGLLGMDVGLPWLEAAFPTLAAGLPGGGAGPAGATALALAAGGTGMMTDSLLGATVERRVRRVDNDVVNFAGATVGALAALALGLPGR